jgi:hypothetical protein
VPPILKQCRRCHQLIQSKLFTYFLLNLSRKYEAISIATPQGPIKRKLKVKFFLCKVKERRNVVPMSNLGFCMVVSKSFPQFNFSFLLTIAGYRAGCNIHQTTISDFELFCYSKVGESTAYLF